MAFQKLKEREAGVIISRKSSSTLWQAPSTFHSLHWSFPLTYNVFLHNTFIKHNQILSNSIVPIVTVY